MPGRHLNQVQIDDLLTYVGVTKRRWKVNGDSCQFCCPIHKESRPSCGVSASLQLFHCFSCSAAGTFDYFLHKALPDEFRNMKQAAEFIRSQYNVDVSLFNDEYLERIMRYEDFYNKEETPRKVKPLHSIAPFRGGEETYQYFYDRGFDDGMLEWFRVGYDTLHRTVTLPVFWEDYTLAGVIGRYIYPRSKAERYKVYDGFMRGDLLFPIDKVVHDGEVVLVEGVFDALRLYQYGHRNVLATMTSSLTPTQVKWLANNTDSVVLMYDNDTQGYNATQKVIRQLKSHVNLHVVSYPDRPEAKDPCDLTRKEVQAMLNTKRSHYSKVIARL